MPKSQAKIKPQFPQYPFLTIFLTLKKYHANKYTFLNLNLIMRIYSNAYNCAMYLKLLIFLHDLSIELKYTPTILPTLLKISINNHLITVYTHK